MKTKIAFLISTLGTGGAEKQLIRTINLLNKNKYEIKLFVLTSVNDLKSELDNEIPVTYFNLTSYANPLSHLKIFKAIRDYNPAIVHSVMYASNLFARIYKIFSPKVKVINHIHGLGSWIKKPHILLDRSLLKYVDKFIVVSQMSKTLRLEREKYPDLKVKVVYNCVNTDIYHPGHIEKNNSEIVVGIACRLIKLKNVSYIIELVKEIQELGLNIKLKIAGDGPEKDNLMNLVNKYNLSNKVHFLGLVKKMPEFYREIDCFVLSSHIEDLPLSIVEALSTGKAFIASNVGGIKELTMNTKSMLFDLESPIQENANKIKEFINNLDFSEPILQNRKFVQDNFSENVHKKKLEIIYNELTKPV
tara:strand:+ start:1451 stop:2533 length:1083 start_codon:yes stop_codon:yes gene_type:complete